MREYTNCADWERLAGKRHLEQGRPNKQDAGQVRRRGGGKKNAKGKAGLMKQT